MTRTNKNRLVLLLGYVVLITGCLLVLLPLSWMVITSLKSMTDITLSRGLKLFPSGPTLENFVNIWKEYPIATYIKNSAIAVGGSTIFGVVCAALCGYGLSRYEFKGKALLLSFLLVTQMFPAVVLMIPLFQSMNNLKLINDLRSLIIVCSCTNLPYCMFMMMGYYNAIPRTLEEAAQVDGCSLLQAVFRILLPAMKPSIVATGAYAFINSWNVYVYATAFITRKEKYTIPLALSIFQGEANTNYGGIAAACVVALIPALLLFSIIQKNLAGGATSGAVKG